MTRAEELWEEYSRREHTEIGKIDFLAALHEYGAEVEAERDALRKMLIRYRNEVPLGHQPHMIAHEVDAAMEGGRHDPR